MTPSNEATPPGRNRSPAVVYQLAIERHHEDLAHGQASRQLAGFTQRQSIRARLANTLATLAAQLDPAASAASQPAIATGATPA
jgi:hypothetical protein